MSEERLRDLLQRALPEAPEVRADDVPARAAAVRRRQVVAGGAALAVVATVVVGGIALRGGDDDAKVASDVPTTPSGSTAPYDVPLCPEALPELRHANTRMPDLGRVVAVRRCPDPYPIGPRRAHPPDDYVEQLANMDALIDVDAFGQALAEVTRFDPGRCATLDVINNRQSLMFVLAGGATQLVPTALCWAIDTEDGRVDGGDLATAFFNALDHQRDELPYTHPFVGSPCSFSAFSGPARPGREELVSACLSGDGGPIDLDKEQLAMLQAAWADPRPVTEDLNESGENDCTESGDATEIYAGTDHGEVVRLIPSPCGYLVWDGWQPDQSAAIPITLEDLGLR